METRLYRFLFQYRLTPQSTTGEVPSELLMGRRPRSRLDLTHPAVEGKVLDQQSKSKDYRGGSDRIFHVGDTVCAMNFGGTPKWLTGVLEEKLGPLTFTVRLPDGRVWKRHVDHIKSRSPNEESNISAETLPRQTYVPVTMQPSSDGANICAQPPPPSPALVNTDTDKQVSPQVPEPQSQSVPKPLGLESTPVVRRSSRATKPPDRLDL